MNRHHLQGQRGFMTAESLTSLFFYIVMVAALAGVGAMLMSKTAGAKGASAVAIARSNLQGMANIMDYDTASIMPVDDATHKLAVVTAPATDGVIPGVGTMKFVPRKINNTPGTPVTELVIELSGVVSPDVCRAVGGVGFGTWVALAKGPVASAGPLPTTPAGSGSAASANGLIPNKTLLETVCAKAGATAAGITLSFVLK